MKAYSEIEIKYTEDSFEIMTNYDDEIVDKYEFAYNLGFIESIGTNKSQISFLKRISKDFIDYIDSYPNVEKLKSLNKIEFEKDFLNDILYNKPVFDGSQYINKRWLLDFFQNLFDIFKKKIVDYNEDVNFYLSEKRIELLKYEGICFNLVENPLEKGTFAFAITYIVNNNGIEQLPIKYLVQNSSKYKFEYNNILSILSESIKESKFLKILYKNHELLNPIIINEEEAYLFLKDVSLFQKKKIICRIPNWWKKRRKNNYIELDLLERINDSSMGIISFYGLSLKPKLIYNGIELTEQEINDIRDKSNGLALINDNWVEIDERKLKNFLDKYEKLKVDGTSLSEVLHLKAELSEENEVKVNIQIPDKWLSKALDDSYKNDELFHNIPKTFKGTLRHYQIEGYKWLYGMTKMGFGLCLADDMGLGKTIQIIAFLEAYKKENKKALLIVPISLISNWENEINKFSSDISYCVARNRNVEVSDIENAYVTITTYQQAWRIKAINEINWGIIILDEAQFIKNYDVVSTINIKKIKKEIGIALTGTPIENNLLNLWSIFDFINPGMLGSIKYFKSKFNYKNVSEETSNRITQIINPFILRRMKTDRNIINDLPDKNEQDIIIDLSKKQLVLYNDIVNNKYNGFEDYHTEFERRAFVLRIIMNLKAICNHPSQYLKDEKYSIEDSAKFQVLSFLCEKIKYNQEQVVIFTQYKEITKPIHNLLKGIFNKDGGIITGDVTLEERSNIINDFQEKKLPFLVLTIKTAGYGLNLTSANNAILFDRWWNPAVESQAIDRIFRIGQKKDVFIYKFVCKDTIEEAICMLLEKKSNIADSIINQISASIISKMSSDELMNIIKLVGEENV